MKKLLLLFCCLLSITTHGKQRKIFQIGAQDDSSKEFALYPNRHIDFVYHFGGLKDYYVGYSKAQNDFPYCMPGPLDNWGGGGFWSGFQPRHFFSIYFNLSKKGHKGMCNLHIGINVAEKTKERTILKVTINGHNFKKKISCNDNEDVLLNKAEGKKQKATITFPSEWLKQNSNKITLGVIKGGWIKFDYLNLSSDKFIEIGKASSTLIKKVKAAKFNYLLENHKQVNPLLVEMNLFEEKEITFVTSDTTSITRKIEKGKTIQEIYLPTIKGDKRHHTSVKIYQEGQLLYKGKVVRKKNQLHKKSEFVDLFMGTANSRWMFKPSSTLPLSMVQIAPDNQNETWKAGYDYSIENIMGFNHFCDWTIDGFIMQPTSGKLLVNPGDENNPDEGYRSRINKKTETAQIGCYSVEMTDTKINASITSTKHAALQKYTFNGKDKNRRILVDLFAPSEYPHNLVDAKVTKVNNQEIEGYATYFNAFTGYSLEQEYTIHFVLQFDQSFTDMGGWTNKVEPVKKYIYNWNNNHNPKNKAIITKHIDSLRGKGDMGFFVNFDNKKSKTIKVRSGVSLVSIDGARNNLMQEIIKPYQWNFDAIVKHSQEVWNTYLNRIEIETSDYLQKRKFYTNLYRALSAKATWNDFDGRYVDENEKIQKVETSNDCIVSGEYWNTFWNNQQLFNLIAPEISEKWARSAIKLYKDSGWFNTDPAGIEHTGVMVAMHVISQIWSTWQSGIHSFNLEEAYNGLRKMMTTPPEKYKGGGTVGVEHLVPYMKYGYIPQGMGYVSNTLEYCYDDWCLAQMAKTLNKDEDYHYFLQRSNNWLNIFDKESGFMRPKDKEGRFIEPFNPYKTPGFVEGNSFNYSWFVPHNPKLLIEKVGKDRFVKRLNDAMKKSSKGNFNATGDDFSSYPINHGNQTSMEVSYLFNWADKNHLTQKWNRAIQEQYYGTTPYDAYLGDEDLGQMSSWYIMSVLGLFQLNGGCSQVPYYELGSPRFKKVTLYLNPKYNRGDKFVIKAHHASKTNKYIQSIRLNGKKLNNFKIPQREIFKGGELEIIMGNKPL